MTCDSCSTVCAALPDGATDLSIFFAKLIGVYLVLVFLSMLLHHQKYKRIMSDFLSNSALLTFAGGTGLLLGLLVVLTHNFWLSEWPVLITLVGWIAVLQGILRLFFPDAYIKLVKEMMTKAGWLIWCWLCFIVGLYLVWVGFGFAQ